MSIGNSKPFVLLLLVLELSSVHTSANSHTNTTVPCLLADAAALLKIKRSFLDADLTTWRAGSDCCRWEGVGCDAGHPTRRVVALDLGGRKMPSRGLDPALFNLTSLRNLSLAGNDFMESRLPSVGFERLTEMVHLDLSSTRFMGQIPIGIGRLRWLVTLNFSSYDRYGYDHGYGYGTPKLFLKEPSFQTFISNLSNLRELSLEGVHVSSSRETWSIALANSSHRLQVLELSNCGLSGSIHQSFSRLHSLVEIKLADNAIAEQIPSQLGNLTRLEALDLSWNHLSGEIPQELTSLTYLSWLNLSYNNLSGRIPQGSQFQTFSYDSFEGNPDLCGSLVSKQCDNPGSTTPGASDHPASNSLWQDRTETILLSTFFGLGFGVGFAVAIMFLHFCRTDGWYRKCFCIRM